MPYSPRPDGDISIMIYNAKKPKEPVTVTEVSKTYCIVIKSCSKFRSFITFCYTLAATAFKIDLNGYIAKLNSIVTTNRIAKTINLKKRYILGNREINQRKKRKNPPNFKRSKLTTYLDQNNHYYLTSLLLLTIILSY